MNASKHAYCMFVYARRCSCNACMRIPLLTCIPSVYRYEGIFIHGIIDVAPFLEHIGTAVAASTDGKVRVSFPEIIGGEKSDFDDQSM